MGNESIKFKQYLLSSLGESEMNKMDLDIISETNRNAELYRAENDLMEDYLEGLLSAGEAREFEREFLVTDERRKDLEFLRLIKKHASAHARAASVHSQAKADSFMSRLGGWFSDFRVPALAAAGLILISLFGLYSLFIKTQNLPSNEIARLNSRDLSDLNEFKAASTFILAAGNSRDAGGEVKKINSNDLTEDVLIRLALPPAVKTESVFDVTLLENDAPVSTLKTTSYSNRIAQEVRLILPREKLRKGKYQIELRNDTGSSLIYKFIVE